MEHLHLEYPRLGLGGRIRRLVGAAVTDGFFKISATTMRQLPIAKPSFHRVGVERDIAYRRTGKEEHLLDVYRPLDREGPLPVVLYIHGGGFRFLSKDTHWLFGLIYARRGYLVVNVNYHLAPEHRFPAAVEDVFAAWQWLLANGERLGADLSRIVVAGESAGANLSTVLALASCYEREEPYCKEVFKAGVVPKAVVAACGIYEVSDASRYGHLNAYWRDRIEEVSDAYLHGVRLRDRRTIELADPLRMLTRKPDRPLPAFFMPCGTWDFLIDDTRRMEQLLVEAGADVEVKEYRGPHAFHAFVVTPSARACWRDTFEFLSRTAA